jgi:hypothetical protein
LGYGWRLSDEALAKAEASHLRKNGLPRRFAPRNDDHFLDILTYFQ